MYVLDAPYQARIVHCIWYVMQFGNTCIRHSTVFVCFFFAVVQFVLWFQKTDNINEASERRWFAIQPRKTSEEERHRSDDGVACKIRDSHKTACCRVHMTGAALFFVVPTIIADGWWYNERNKYISRNFMYSYTSTGTMSNVIISVVRISRWTGHVGHTDIPWLRYNSCR